MKKIGSFGVVFLAIGLLNGCSVSKIHQDTIKQTNQTFSQDLKMQQKHEKAAAEKLVIPDSVFQSLSPVVSNGHLNSQNETVFDLKVRDMPVAKFLNALMQGLNKSIVVSPQLTQRVSLTLNQTTLTKVLVALHDLYGISVTKTAYGYRAVPVKLETRIFTLNRINLDRTSSTNVSVSNANLGTDDDTGSGSRSINVASTSSNKGFWNTVKSTLASLVAKDKGGKVEVNPISGVVIVTAKPATLKLVAKYLDQTQAILNRQVIIDAKIIEIELSKGFQTGIDWSNIGFSSIGSTGVYTLESGMSAKSIKAVITALSSEGQVSVLSSPRVVTMNNQHALIEVGTNQYFVTKVTTGVTQTSATNTLSTNDVDLKPFFSGISLSVLPQINQNGEITLFIHPAITTVTEDKRHVEVSTTQKLVLPLAKSDVRETDSIVRVKSGQVIVLGGLMQNRATSDGSGLPGLASLGLTTQNTNSGKVTELAILLKATVPGEHTWSHQLKDYQNQYNHIINHYGVSS